MTDRYADLRAGLESLQHATGELRGPEAQVADLLADYDRLRDALAEIADYWNRDQNDQAMYDACWHAINTANAALQESSHD